MQNRVIFMIAQIQFVHVQLFHSIKFTRRKEIEARGKKSERKSSVFVRAGWPTALENLIFDGESSKKLITNGREQLSAIIMVSVCYKSIRFLSDGCVEEIDMVGLRKNLR